MYNNIKRIHLIGIGGIGVSGIAELLHKNGYSVSGSDRRANETVTRLRSLGITVWEGHRKENVEGAELVVFSSAVSHENPELVRAKELGIPTIRRAEMLAELMRIKYGLAVAGAHGKTTTTSLIGWVLMQGDLDPTIVVGGRMDNFGGTNARLGNGPFMVVEADESDGSFNRLSPSIAVVTNLDREHMEFYKNMRQLRKEFVRFLQKVPFYGLCVLCGDDPSLKLIEAKLTQRVKTYGFARRCHYRIENYVATEFGSHCRVVCGEDSFELAIKMPGRHNVLNAVASIVVADELKIPREKSLAALAKYDGVQRRFQSKGEIDGIRFIDDYAHHPTEIRSTISAAKERFPNSRIHVLFQPHRFSRTSDLFEDFARCFGDADHVSITDIFAAGEEQIPGVSAPLLVEAIEKHGHPSVTHVGGTSEAMSSMRNKAEEGDVILTLGAGDIPSVYQDLV